MFRVSVRCAGEPLERVTLMLLLKCICRRKLIWHKNQIYREKHRKFRQRKAEKLKGIENYFACAWDHSTPTFLSLQPNTDTRYSFLVCFWIMSIGWRGVVLKILSYELSAWRFSDVRYIRTTLWTRVCMKLTVVAITFQMTFCLAARQWWSSPVTSEPLSSNIFIYIDISI